MILELGLIKYLVQSFISERFLKQALKASKDTLGNLLLFMDLEQLIIQISLPFKYSLPLQVLIGCFWSLLTNAFIVSGRMKRKVGFPFSSFPFHHRRIGRIHPLHLPSQCFRVHAQSRKEPVSPHAMTTTSQPHDTPYPLPVSFPSRRGSETRHYVPARSQP